MPVPDIYYLIGNGESSRIWSVAEAEYVTRDELPEGAELTRLETAEGVSDESYLADTLEFYGWPPGILALKNVQGIKRRLAELDAEYLTSRTLAGIGANDPQALARWNEHEEKAIPLREKLAQLENGACRD